MITITLKGFKTKQEAIDWLNQYEGGGEQYFDTEAGESEIFPCCCLMETYISEMEDFKNNDAKTNFNLDLK